ncbi:30S ribosomal protein S20 [Magnetococcus sp. PR-3]|uniref:30S ribosomal protein S20 n=1 Tax=Magnetococcus sp. PR-3 TaxID=3120355 RepID=UPI002FCE0CF3
MANHKSALKRIRQTAKRTEANRNDKARMRTFVKKVTTAVQEGNVELAQQALREASAVITRTAQRGVIHRNQASRRISRLNSQVKKLATAS